VQCDVRVGTTKDPLHLRLVGVHTPKGDGCCLTKRPPRIGPRPVADLYRVRWAVELNLKVDQSVHRLDQIDAERLCSVKTLLHTSLLAHTHQMQTHPPQEGTTRTEALLHPRRFAWPLAVSCQSMAQAFDLKGTTATRRWQQIAALLRHRGKDPHGRRRPSSLDQRRGWKRQPVARKPANRDYLKATA